MEGIGDIPSILPYAGFLQERYVGVFGLYLMAERYYQK
jgi:hypothetical protein